MSEDYSGGGGGGEYYQEPLPFFKNVFARRVTEEEMQAALIRSPQSEDIPQRELAKQQVAADLRDIAAWCLTLSNTLEGS